MEIIRASQDGFRMRDRQEGNEGSGLWARRARNTGMLKVRLWILEPCYILIQRTGVAVAGSWWIPTPQAVTQ